MQYFEKSACVHLAGEPRIETGGFLGNVDFGSDVPAVNFIKHAFSLRGSMGLLQIIFNPLDEVIFKCALDKLMEKVRRKKFMNVRSWEPHCERLRRVNKYANCGSVSVTTCLEVRNNSVIVP